MIEKVVRGCADMSDVLMKSGFLQMVVCSGSGLNVRFYSRCQKNVPVAGRFFATTLMPPSYFLGHDT